MNGFHNGSQSIEVVRVAAVFGKKRLALCCTDFGMGHVHGNDRCGLITTVFIFEADHQWAPLHHEGYIGGIPVAVLKKQIFTFFKAEQRNGVQIPRLSIFEEQQRITALQSSEIRWDTPAQTSRCRHSRR